MGGRNRFERRHNEWEDPPILDTACGMETKDGRASLSVIKLVCTAVRTCDESWPISRSGKVGTDEEVKGSFVLRGEQGISSQMRVWAS